MGDKQKTPIIVSEDHRHIFWLKKDGVQVKEGEALASMEAGKGTSFIASPATGTLGDIVVKNGDVTTSGEPIAYIFA